MMFVDEVDDAMDWSIRRLKIEAHDSNIRGLMLMMEKAQAMEKNRMTCSRGPHGWVEIGRK